MASFLRNDGDILLDAVLTDYGRKLLAKGDGSFNITKFAFADDEIDYTQYNTGSITTSRDVDIMKTPIMEAITNNAASMKSPLLTIEMENILFMPSMKLYTLGDYNTSSIETFKGYIVPVNATNDSSKSTISYLKNDNNYIPGVLNIGKDSRMIRVDNGIDSNKLSSEQSLENVYPSMYEKEFNVYVDNRFCSVGAYNSMGASAASLFALRPLSVDDDNFAIYRITNQTSENNITFVSSISLDKSADTTPIKGTRGSRISFTLVPTQDLETTNALFEKYGKIRTINNKEFYTIRSSVTVEGITIGSSIEIPIMFAKIKDPT